MGHGFKATRLDPTLGLLMHREPRGQIVGNHPPRAPGANHVARRIEEGSHRVFTLRSIFIHQRQIGRAKLPFLIADIARVIGFGALGLVCHPKGSTPSVLKSTAIIPIKPSTRNVHDTLYARGINRFDTEDSMRALQSRAVDHR